MSFALGDTYLPQQEVNQHGIVPNAVGSSLGFQEGDKIINISGRAFERFSDVLQPYTLLEKNGYYTVLRAGQEIRIDIPTDLVERLSDPKEQGLFVTPRAPFTIGQVQQHSGADQAGLQPGDQIFEVAGQETIYFHQLQEVLTNNAGRQVLICYVRAGTPQTTMAEVNAVGKLGFQPNMLLTYKTSTYNIGQAMVVGTLRTFDVIRTHVVALGKVLTGQLSPAKSLSGPIGIVQVFGKSFDWLPFWNITGFLSLALALTNLLPIPALDGGHALWIVYEMITGRKLSDRFLATAQKIGMGILLFLISYTIINDLYKLW